MDRLMVLSFVLKVLTASLMRSLEGSLRRVAFDVLVELPLPSDV